MSQYCYVAILLLRTTVTSHYCYVALLLRRTTVTSRYCYVPLLLRPATVTVAEIDKFIEPIILDIWDRWKHALLLLTSDAHHWYYTTFVAVPSVQRFSIYFQKVSVYFTDGLMSQVRCYNDLVEKLLSSSVIWEMGWFSHLMILKWWLLVFDKVFYLVKRQDTAIAREGSVILCSC